MALSYDFVICAVMLPLTVHSAVLGLRDMCYHATFECAWAVLGVRAMCAFMFLLTVHGVVSGPRDMSFHVTLDCTWRCLKTS